MNQIQLSSEHLEKTDLHILSEENKVVAYEERVNWDSFWLIDPLDGTKEFINKRSEYTINIALIKNGVPILGVVYAPVLSTLYYGSEQEGSFKKVITADEQASSILQTSERLSAKPIPTGLRVVASRSHLSEETKRVHYTTRKIPYD